MWDGRNLIPWEMKHDTMLSRHARGQEHLGNIYSAVRFVRVAGAWTPPLGGFT